MEQRSFYASRGDIRRKPKGAGLQVDRLMDSLRGRGWVSARKLAIELRTDARTIRAIAHESRGEIAGGQQGYCLSRELTIGELDHVIARFYSQARETRERGMELERVRFTRQHGAVA